MVFYFWHMGKAVVLGATSGIGRELALLLSQNGYRVGITGRREALLAELKDQAPTSFVAAAFDATAATAITQLDDLVSELGGLDLLILSSGTGDINHELHYAIENRTNQLNVVAFTQIAGWSFSYFKKQGRGQLAVISSIAGIRGNRMGLAYNASKAYQINYLEGLRQKATHEKLNMTITDIRPGFVDTAMAKGEGKFWVAPPKKAARQIIRAIERKKGIVYITKRWQIIAFLLKILPSWIHKRM